MRQVTGMQQQEDVCVGTYTTDMVVQLTSPKPYAVILLSELVAVGGGFTGEENQRNSHVRDEVMTKYFSLPF